MKKRIAKKQVIKKQPVNRKHKDRLFRMAFQEKKYQLELYNAINGTDYQNPEDLIVTTLEDAVFLGMKNDLSFIVGVTMNLYEHQSSKNLNMPLRGLIYFAELYQNYVTEHGYDIYGEGRIPLPFPNYIVFYNGEKDAPDEEELMLSDSFIKGQSTHFPAVECRARILNINKGHNQELLKKCQRLNDYSTFIACVREKLSEGADTQKAVSTAMDQCIREGILTDVLIRNKTEVFHMLLAEYDEKATRAYWKKEIEERVTKEVTENVTQKVTKEVTKEVTEEMSNLFHMLLTQGKYEEAKRVASDADYRDKMLEKYKAGK